MALILDTSVLYASLDRGDAAHAASRALLEAAHDLLVIPSPVLVELDYLLASRKHPGVFLNLMDDILAGAYAIEEPHQSDYERIRDLCNRYADADIGFVDAAIVATAERLEEPRIATLDHRHFRTIRPRHVDAFSLLPS